eukprot:gnl/MRDRNA2_/MRDRNA2_200012_c0_seq1.p1 gnl/MRDRNA2_/MRDRNA2_200012_c0~~gnl/MRDRNA2_/MRDRNA2_200012_c0_seq1.p1  ORF type:complete len:606 (+),score=112.58 gnl/MRDRNA2_/MRDRNA2_200012_c0_seq1:115-1818(+)
MARGYAPEVLVCETTHLSSFAAIWREVQMAVLCSNLNLFTMSSIELFCGLKDTGDGFWLFHPIGILWLSLIFVSSTLLLVAAMSDAKAASEHRWSDDEFIIDAVEEDEEQPGGAEPKKKEGLMEKITCAALQWVVHQNVAAKAGIHQNDMDVAIGNHVAKHGGLHTKATKANLDEDVVASIENLFAAEHIDHVTIKNSLQTSVKSSFGQKVGLLMHMAHPVLSLMRFSVIVPHRIRTLLYLDTLWGSMFLSAMFFSASGDALSIETPDACAKEDIPYVRAIVIGVITSVFSAAIMKAFAMLHKRNFMYCDKGSEVWDPKKKKAILRKWKIQDAFLFSFTSLYMVFSMLFVGLFTASITDRDKYAFLTSTLTAVVKAWLILPLVMSIVLAALANMLKAGHPWIEKIEKKLGLSQLEILELQGKLMSKSDLKVPESVPKEDPTPIKDPQPDPPLQEENKIESKVADEVQEVVVLQEKKAQELPEPSPEPEQMKETQQLPEQPPTDPVTAEPEEIVAEVPPEPQLDTKTESADTSVPTTEFHGKRMSACYNLCTLEQNASPGWCSVKPAS